MSKITAAKNSARKVQRSAKAARNILLGAIRDLKKAKKIFSGRYQKLCQLQLQRNRHARSKRSD